MVVYSWPNYRPVLMRTERDRNKFSESIYYFVYEG